MDNEIKYILLEINEKIKNRNEYTFILTIAAFCGGVFTGIAFRMKDFESMQEVFLIGMILSFVLFVYAIIALDRARKDKYINNYHQKDECIHNNDYIVDREKLAELASMKAQGMISEQEFEERISQITKKKNM